MLKEDSNIKKFFKDINGMIFSIDVMMALILITIIIGMSANALDIVNFKITDYSAGKSLDRIAIEATEILINTPGSSNWEESNNTLFVTPGLAEDNNDSKNSTNTLNINKISQLKNNYYPLMSNMLPRGGHSSLIIYPTDSTIGPIEINNETPIQSKSDIAVVNRSVLIKFNEFKILACIYCANHTNTDHSENSSEQCPHYNLKNIKKHIKPDYNNKTPGWSCKYFKVTQEDLNTTDFYLMTEPSFSTDISAKWELDRPDHINEELENFKPSPQLINDKIRNILGEDQEALVWIHVFSSGDAIDSFNTYVIGVPKGTSSEEVRIEYLNPQPCFFVLKLWME
ncbi:MAG: hypothetical protein LLF83_04745 [Methanobacterium sp.]|nr:hypothetical protein [Methanobacterium sp.]